MMDDILSSARIIELWEERNITKNSEGKSPGKAMKGKHYPYIIYFVYSNSILFNVELNISIGLI